jgi:hypothetical protein
MLEGYKMSNVAIIIRNQIAAMDARALRAWGTKDLCATENGLKFKTSGMVRWKGYVEITYDHGQDLYNIDFYQIRKSTVKYVQRLKGVFVDQLVSSIDLQVG